MLSQTKIAFREELKIKNNRNTTIGITIIYNLFQKGRIQFLYKNFRQLRHCSEAYSYNNHNSYLFKELHHIP